ncbi:hypothetical protein B0H11DRAFT_2251729 [Mycena galericulata]|nr:hypothetical protein B0H11DRAFT_2251729 [Mycena galericulata]
MANTSPDATNTPTPEEELAALVAQVGALSKLALDMTRSCIDISDSIPRIVRAQVIPPIAKILPPGPLFDSIPRIVRAQVDAAIAKILPPGPLFFRSVAPTPAQIEARFPPGTGDNQPWYVVCIGRSPGLYATSQEADDQVNGVPNQSRKKKDSRQEALLYYRSQYEIGEVMQVSEGS